MTPPAAVNPAPSILSSADWQRLSSSAQGYALASFELLEIAAGHLQNGDLRQASEMGWGAAAQMVKAVAENWIRHGARHHSHWDLSGMVIGLSIASPATEIARLFGDAQDLHRNFYENNLPANDVSIKLDRCQRFVAEMAEWLRWTAPPANFTQGNRRRRAAT